MSTRSGLKRRRGPLWWPLIAIVIAIVLVCASIPARSDVAAATDRTKLRLVLADFAGEFLRKPKHSNNVHRTSGATEAWLRSHGLTATSTAGSPTLFAICAHGRVLTAAEYDGLLLTYVDARRALTACSQASQTA